jgi:acyl-CoA thioesterase-1
LCNDVIAGRLPTSKPPLQGGILKCQSFLDAERCMRAAKHDEAVTQAGYLPGEITRPRDRSVINGAKQILRALLMLATVAAVVCPAGAQVVCLGASNTAGKGVSPQEAYPAQLEVMLRARHYDGRVANAGISGDTTWGMLNRLETAVPTGTRVVILQPGGNDARRGTASWRDANISQIVERLTARQVAVIMLENQLIGEIRRQGYGSDGQHLTAEGYRLLAAQLLPGVATALGLPPS